MKYYLWYCVLYQWLKDGFLKYLQDWEESVNNRESFDRVQRYKMILSAQTMEGLRITGDHTQIEIKLDLSI